MSSRPTLLEVVRDRIRAKHYSPRTEEAYTMWVRRYVRYYRGKHPRELGPTHVRDFLTHLARDGRVAASTQNQALAALLFLYGRVLEMPIAAPFDHMHAKGPMRLPVVLTRDEVDRVMAQLRGPTLLMSQLMYGGGLRLMECCRLRVKDLDLERGELVVREGKGQRDRVTVIPQQVIRPLRAHLVRVAQQHDRDIKAGGGYVELPGALRRKLVMQRPRAGRGSGCFRPLGRIARPRAARRDVITCTRRCFSVR